MMFFALCISLMVQIQLCATDVRNEEILDEEDVIQALTQGENDKIDRKVIRHSVKDLPAHHLTQTFIDTVNQLSSGLSEGHKSTIIIFLKDVPANHLTQAFIDTVNQLSQGVSRTEKPSVILSVNRVFLANRQIPIFIETVNQLSQCVKAEHKHNFIGHLSRISDANWLTLTSNLSTLERIFTPDRTVEFNRFVPYFEMKTFIDILFAMPPERWEPEAIRMIDQYRHDSDVSMRSNLMRVPAAMRAPAAIFVNSHGFPDVALPVSPMQSATRRNYTSTALEIHAYARTMVETSSSSSNSLPNGSSSSSSQKTRLEDAVMQKMGESLQKQQITVMQYEKAKDLLVNWIEEKYKDDLEALNKAKQVAFFRLVNDTNYEQTIALAVTFLQSLHPTKIDLWLDGFLGESMEAYKGSKNPTSCTKGIGERATIGMRCVDDDFTKLFAGAEGNLTFNIYCNRWNLYDENQAQANLQWVANKLYTKGVRKDTSEEKVAEVVSDIIVEDLSSYGNTNMDTAKSLAAGAVEIYWKDIKTQLKLIELQQQKIASILRLRHHQEVLHPFFFLNLHIYQRGHHRLFQEKLRMQQYATSE